MYENPQGTLESDPTGPGLYQSVAWTGSSAGAGRAISTWLDVILSSGTREAMHVVRECPQPTLCFVFADSDNHIGLQGTGRFPKRGTPDVVKRVATPPGGIEGSQGAMMFQTQRSGIPGRVTGKQQQDDHDDSFDASNNRNLQALIEYARSGNNQEDDDGNLKVNDSFGLRLGDTDVVMVSEQELNRGINHFFSIGTDKW